MKITREEVLHCAELACLRLREEEIEGLRQDMERLLSQAERLGQLSLDDVPPWVQGLPVDPGLRPDRVQSTFSQAEALGNAPESAQGHFVVPRVL
ncbi:MAG: Asp-tRNA(Asn)/Glu-tRNA(Gln) amidotransferase subunit GatC [Acidobacteria bacterium]|nr:Asp-tRNA(Asn)/Glu-tRNA(Gln) amidotransferase subunit GatC [Acidobacteriota bacterium]